MEIGLTSHIGQAHTVNIDPKRPHIAYAVTSDVVSLGKPGDPLFRQNEDPADSDRLDLDGFEIVDMASRMDFPAGTTVAQKRDACRPKVFRYRYEDVKWALGHTIKTSIYGCHETEITPEDRLTCGGGAALLEFNMNGAFDDQGTPNDYSDDTVRGQALPCRVRASSTVGLFGTGAKVTDCVDGTGAGEEDLDIPSWIASGSPSVEGIAYLGSVHH